MKLSKLFTKTLREAPKDAVSVSHKFLTRAGYIDNLIAGVYSLLPLGFLVQEKVIGIIRDEMRSLDALEIFMPTLQKKSQWMESGRWDTYDPPLFKLEDRHGKELALGPTHEEVVTDLAGKMIKSYKDLPVFVFQIQNKFRNEMRSTGGLLRTREFMMKDLYSFHESEDGLDKFFNEVIKSYLRIFSKCGLEAKMLSALSGSIGGTGSKEFGVLADSGEDTMYYCAKCEWAVNREIEDNVTKCPNCGGKAVMAKNIENGHIFKLNTKYSKVLKAYFTNKNGERKPVQMGCYGIGIGRLIATIVEVHHDDKGIVWPKTVSPFDMHLISLGNDASVNEVCNKLHVSAASVLWDDRDETAGVKFNDADLIGIPIQVVVTPESVKQNKAEVVDRKTKEKKEIRIEEIVNI